MHFVFYLFTEGVRNEDKLWSLGLRNLCEYLLSQGFQRLSKRESIRNFLQS